MTEHVSPSQLQKFDECSKMWELQYRRRLRRITPRSNYSAMSVGSMVHHGMHAALTHAYDTYHTATLDNLIVVASDSIKEWWQENRPPDDIDFVVRFDGQEDYTKEQHSESLDRALGVVAMLLRVLEIGDKYIVVGTDIIGDEEPRAFVEFEVRTPCVQFAGETVEFLGRIDALLYNRHEGHLELVDWKTTKGFKNESARTLDDQVALYQFALYKEYGVYIPVGVVFQVRSYPPRVPTLLKAKKKDEPRKMSVAKNQATDWYTYKRALLEAGLDPNDYLEMKRHFAEKPLYLPVWTYRSMDSLRALWHNFVTKAALMFNQEAYPYIFDAYLCGKCAFQEYCRTYMDAFDPDITIGDVYEVMEVE